MATTHFVDSMTLGWTRELVKVKRDMSAQIASSRGDDPVRPDVEATLAVLSTAINSFEQLVAKSRLAVVNADISRLQTEKTRLEGEAAPP